MEKASDLKQMSEEELKKKESDIREALFNLRFQQKVGQVENPLKLRTLRRDLARVLTFQNGKKREKLQNAAEAK